MQTKADRTQHGKPHAVIVVRSIGNPADLTSWMPAIEQHQACFGRAPEMATGDRGFFSDKNQRAAQNLGLKKVALPGRGRLSVKRAKNLPSPSF